MSGTVEIRDMQPDEAGAVAALVQASFARFVAPEFDALGIENFCRFATANQIALRQTHGFKTLIAEQDGQICGMAQFRPPAHVLMLFVESRYHGRGIARRLLDEGVAHLCAQNPSVQMITVNSSPHAVPAYERLGFAATGPMSNDGGILSVPMRRLL